MPLGPIKFSEPKTTSSEPEKPKSAPPVKGPKPSKAPAKGSKPKSVKTDWEEFKAISEGKTRKGHSYEYGEKIGVNKYNFHLMLAWKALSEGDLFDFEDALHFAKVWSKSAGIHFDSDPHVAQLREACLKKFVEPYSNRAAADKSNAWLLLYEIDLELAYWNERHCTSE